MRAFRFVLCVVFAVMLPQTFSYAQQGPPQRTLSIEARATIIDNLSLVTLRDVNLTPTNAVEGIIRVSPVTSPYAGLLRIEGQPGKVIRITYLTSETLIEEGGNGGVIKASYFLSGFDADNQLASQLLDIGEANIRLGKSGRYYLWLGANLDITQAIQGSYQSEFIIEMEGN